MRDAALRLDDLVTSDPAIMGGRRVFRGTRVPVDVLFENLDRDDVVAVLERTAPRAA